MADIATLGIKVTTEGVAQASSDLDKLGRSGANAAVGAQKVAPAMDKAAVSAKQLQFATRQLPAQFTDIFTGLASGQAPLQVLIQQGGQLKDTFGGVGPALRASVGYIAGLINPITLVAAAVAGLGVAYFKGAQESVEFNKALILTGNYANTTADALADMAAQMDSIAGVTTRSASAALAEVASTGRFTADQIGLVATAAENMRAGTGKAVEDTVKEFVRLRDDPVRAILQLNETYHFLTRSTYDQIKALQEQGREADAATVAIEAYAGAINDRIPRLTENLGLLERAWRGIKGAASEAWDEMLVIGRKTTPTDLRGDISMWQADIARNPQMSAVQRAAREQQIRHAQAEIQRLSRPRAQFIEAGSGIVPPARTVDSNALRAQIKAQEEFDRLRVSNLSKAAKLEEEIADIRKKGLAAGKSEAEIQKTIADARARYTESLAKGSRGGTKADPSASILQQLRTQIALNEEQATSEKNLTESQRLRIRVTEQLETLGGKVSASRRAEIQAELERLNTTDAAVQKAKEQIQVETSLLRLREQIARTEAARAQANRVDLLGIGRGAQEVERQRRALDIEYDYQNELRELYRQAAREKRQVTQQEEDELSASRDRMLDMERDYYAQRDAMQADWKNGAVRAFEDYMAEANDVAGRTAEAIDGVLNSLQGTFEEFFRTGKLDWKGFLDDINAELARFFSQQLVKQLLNMGSQNGSEGGWAADLMSLFSSSDQYTGFSKGGYTGPGGKNKPAGIVHAGEYVLNQDAVRGLPMGYLDHLNRGGSPAISAGGGDLYQSITVQGRLDRRSVDQLAAESMRRQNLSRRRTG